MNLPFFKFLWKVQKQFLQPIDKRKIKKRKKRENSVFNGKNPHLLGFPGGSDGKESACNAGDLSSIPGLGRSSGEGNGKFPSGNLEKISVKLGEIVSKT